MKSLLLTEESYRNNSKLAWLLILLALLINFALMFLLFILQTDNNFFKFPSLPETEQEEAPVLFEQMAEPPPPAIEPPQPPTNEIAALKPGASNFGVPDDYDENEMSARINNEKPEEKPFEPELAAVEEKITPEQEEIKPPCQPPSEPKMKEKEQELAQPQPVPQTILEKTNDKPQQPDAPQKPKLQPKPPAEKLPEAPQKIKAPLKKELTFNDIAKGFLSSLDEGGNDLVERKGNENIRPDFEEMRTLSYQHKIFWNIQNELQRNNLSLNYPVPPLIITGISMTIDKDGTLKKASVIQSCGIHQLDDAIINAIRAGNPYPPLPNFLNKDSYTFEFGVKHVQTTPGFNNHFRR